jgi:head-tail adaptor
VPSSWNRGIRPVKSGRYRQRVLLFDVPEATVDSFGQPSTATVQIANANASDGGWWAEVTPLRGDEILNVRNQWPTASHIVRMRWLGSSIPTSPDNPNGLLMPQMKLQLLLDNSVLNMLFVDNIDKRNHEFEITCEEHVGSTQ